MKKRSEPASMGDNSGNINSQHLRAFIERVERLEEEKSALAEDIREVLSEAKSSGFDPKILRKVIALRKMDRDKRVEQETLIELYMNSLGDLATTPLGKAAIERAVA